MQEEQYNQPVDGSLIACPHCDLLQRLPNLVSAASARCPRCNEELWRRRADSLNRCFALALAAAVLYLIANTVPMLGLTVVGREASTTIMGGVEHLWHGGQVIVALLVLFTAVVAPALQILLMLVIVLGTRQRTVPRWLLILIRHYGTTQTWSMVEVMMLGVLVALVKIADYATVIPGTALFVLGGLIAVLAAMQASFDPDEVWGRVRWVALPYNAAISDGRVSRAAVTPSRVLTAMQEGLQRCETCGLVSRPQSGEEQGSCPRCGEMVEFRSGASIERTWAFVIAAAICYIPANVLPVLTTTTTAGTTSDTILQGVVLLWSPTGWPLSLIVLVASIIIPSAKILALGYLLIAVQRGSAKNNEQRTRLYRTLEFIGRWSMVDVFVDTFTAALVQLQPLMAVEPGPGLVFFAAVVVLTMLAVESFDPRLIWDAASTMETRYA
ncbi:MAG TPA: paraquat-inducible protein A [Candidatus Binataceae bacterium]|nr:paraquat-inducible protein A [Candidatus Binataceae bacterium]